MNVFKLLFALIVVLLYIPMVFVGANVIFPGYAGADSYYRAGIPDCYNEQIPEKEVSSKPRQESIAEQRRCQQEYETAQRKWEQEKLAYEGKKYVFIAIFNLAVLLIALFAHKFKGNIEESIIRGLFLGSIAATFGATVRYFDSRSKIGFLILVSIFFTMLYFINSRKSLLIGSNITRNIGSNDGCNEVKETDK